MEKRRMIVMLFAVLMCIVVMKDAAGDLSVSAASPADQATIEVGKTLTVNGSRFPDIRYFRFRMEAVSGYTNPNISTAIDGQTIAASKVPMPEGTPVGDISVTADAGDFKTTVSSGSEPDTQTKKTRKKAFGKITYDTAGYYMYRIKELGSLKDPDAPPSVSVPGVSYDESSYYVVVYVVNNTGDNGDTQRGVHVQSVTAWHNSKSASVNASEILPNLKDIAAGGKTNGDDDTGDNGGKAAGANSTYGGGQTATSDPAGEQRWDGLGKVGRSAPPADGDVNNENGDNRNVLDANKYWNRQEMHDVSLMKNVKGNLGDISKQFEFTVTMSGLEANGSYTIRKTGEPVLFEIGAGNGGKGSVTDSQGAGTVTADAAGAAVFLVRMSDDQGVVMKDLPLGAAYKVSEAASNHAPSYRITSSNTKTGDGSAVIAKSADNTSDEKEKALTTASETVDSADGNITVTYTNERNLETITGIPGAGIYFVIIAIAAMSGMIMQSTLSKRNRKKMQHVRS